MGTASAFHVLIEIRNRELSPLLSQCQGTEG